MLTKRGLFVIIGLLILSTTAQAKTEPFFPDHTRRLSGVSWGDKPYSEIDNLFLNPATFARNEAVQFHLGHGQYAFEYSSLSAGLVLKPIYGTTLAFAFDHYTSASIPEVQHNGYRPYVAGEYADTYQTARITAAHSLSRHIHAGTALDLKGRQIKEIGATGGSLDFGLAWDRFSRFNLGLHTRNLIQAPLNWSTGHTETFTPSTVLEVNSHWGALLTGVNMEFTEDGVRQHSVGLETLLADTFGLFTRGFFEPEHGMTQYNIGATLYASNFMTRSNGETRYVETQFKYVYQNFSKNGLVDSQHLIVINLIYD